MPTFVQARYKISLDPTVEEVKKLCTTCRKYAKSERVLFHYNGHGVPKPTPNGEIWLFNKVCYSNFRVIPISYVVAFSPLLIGCYIVELYAVHPLAN